MKFEEFVKNNLNPELFGGKRFKGLVHDNAHV